MDERTSTSGMSLIGQSRQIIPNDNPILKDLAARGIICQIFGHNWTDSTPNWIYTSMVLDGSVQQRQCKVCGLKQRYIPESWEDIETEKPKSSDIDYGG